MKKISYQGERGAFSEIAAEKYFGEQIEFYPAYSFNDVFKRVKKKSVDFGIVPIENSLYGSVFETYDLLLKYKLNIQGELNLKINHALISDKRYKIPEIKHLYSHPQALGQCSDFLARYSKINIHPAYDTAGAVLLTEKEEEPSAAIASEKAANIYGKKIIKRKIQNNDENYTRFLIVGRNRNSGETENPKTSICFELKSIPGALFRALSVFALRDIDLLKIESRPIPHKPFTYLFYVDLTGSINDTVIKNALNNLSEITLRIIKFGSYSAGKTFSS